MMNKIRTAYNKGLLELWYILGSVFIGPFIAISSVGFTSGGGDYCDGSYFLNDGGAALAQRDAEFARAALYSKSLSSISFAIGVALALSLVIRYKKGTVKLKELIVMLSLISIMLFGYAIVFLISGPGGQKCG